MGERATAKALAALIRAELAEQGLSQARLALRTGYTPKHISQVLTGRVTGRIEVFDRCAKALGVHFDVVLRRGS